MSALILILAWCLGWAMVATGLLSLNDWSHQGALAVIAGAIFGHVLVVSVGGLAMFALWLRSGRRIKQGKPT